MQIAVPFKSLMFDPDLVQKDFLRNVIKEAKAGNAAAFEQLLASHGPLVLRFAQRILLNREAAQDAAQEVFIRLHKNLKKVDEQRDFTAWLYRTTSNICYDILRRNRRHLPLDVCIEPTDRSLDPEQSLNSAQEKRLLLSALATLTARERETVTLRDLEGLPVSEVARILNVAEGTVRSQLSTGRIKIRNFVMAQLRTRT